MSIPYPSIASLPKDIRNVLPRPAQEIFRNTFNAAAEKTSEERALTRAWSAVKAKFKKEGAEWVAKDNVSDEMMAFDEMIALDAEAKLRETADGYLVCSPRIARTGVQEYAGWEVGKPEMEKVRVYRPEAEVFHIDAIASLAFKPVTNEHPSDLIGPDNWREFAVGHLGGDMLRDGDFIRMPLIVMDSGAIGEVRDGKKELSVGYTALLKWGDGTTPQGEQYNATQHDIRANHLAITQKARGGSKLRMGDNRKPTPKEKKMRTFVIDGITVEMEERDQQVVERAINKLETELTAAQTELNTLRATSATELATARTETANAASTVQTKDAEIATLKQQLIDSKITPQELDRRVTERVATVQKAKAILGDALVLDGKTDADIKKQVVLAKLGDQAKDWNDEMMTASFNTLTAVAGTPTTTNDTQRVTDVLLLNNNGGTDPRSKAYAEYDEVLSNRWKTAGVRTQ